MMGQKVRTRTITTLYIADKILPLAALALFFYGLYKYLRENGTFPFRRQPAMIVIPIKDNKKGL